MKCIFGIGGGSDFHTACLMAEPDDMVVTALAPIYQQDGEIDWTQTINKYTGKPFHTGPSTNTQQNLTYTCYTLDGSPRQNRILQDCRRPNSFGLVVCSRKLVDEFIACAADFRDLVGDREIFAVDTGGDCLRDLVPGMGDTDISYLFGGSGDTRDRDSIELIRVITGKPVQISIVGPGSDGETSGEGIANALEDLMRGLSSSVSLLRIRHCNEFKLRIERTPAWENPLEDSTLNNIKKGLSAKDTLERIPVVRKGVVVNHVEARHLSSIWEVVVTYSLDK